MAFTHAVTLFIEYRYWALIPLAIIEGPVIAFVAGALAAAGYFNIFFLGVLFFTRDMLMDSMYYAIGYYGADTHVAKRILRKLRIQNEHLQAVRVLWEKYPARTMFIGKISYGVASSFIVVAGIIKMRLRKFYGYGSLVAILQFWTLLALGYFYGAALGGTIVSALNNFEYAIAGFGIILVGYYYVSLRARKIVLQEDAEL